MVVVDPQARTARLASALAALSGAGARSERGESADALLEGDDKLGLAGGQRDVNVGLAIKTIGHLLHRLTLVPESLHTATIRPLDLHAAACAHRRTSVWSS